MTKPDQTHTDPTAQPALDYDTDHDLDDDTCTEAEAAALDDTVQIFIDAMNAAGAATFGQMVDYCRDHHVTPMELAATATRAHR